MAKKEEEEKDWTPDQPIPDEEGEASAQNRVMLERRINYLKEQSEKKAPKKKGAW